MVEVVLLAVAGFVGSVVNVVAGGGSFLTLPVLLLLGHSASEANATNRVGVMAQNAGAVWSFNRRRVIDWAWARDSFLPTVLGATVGAVLALWVGDRQFRRLLAFIMVAVTLWTVLDPRRRNRSEAGPPLAPWLLRGGFLLVGLYGGFAQAGVGFFAIALAKVAGIDLVRGSALKVLIGLIQAAVSLLIFAVVGKVLWLPGLALALGGILGGQCGVHLAVLKGQRWLEQVVTAVVLLFAVLLWLDGPHGGQ
jgi:uncharacterized membrane protein YfcA